MATTTTNDGDPLEHLLGSQEAGIPDLSQHHDEYLGQEYLNPHDPAPEMDALIHNYNTALYQWLSGVGSALDMKAAFDRLPEERRREVILNLRRDIAGY